MYKLPLEKVKEKLVESGKISMEDLDSKIQEKINELSGLISEEGAAHIIANELGVAVIPDAPAAGARVKLGDIQAGMNNLEIVAKVASIWDMRTFNKNDYQGKVQSMLIADDSGRMRLTLWNDQVDNFAEGKEGDVLLIKGVYAKENNGRVEISLGRGGSFELNPEGETGLADLKVGGGFERKDLISLQGGEENVEVLGTIVQVFDPRFFQVHPETGRRIRDDDDSGVEPALSYVMNLIVDDGSSNIRCVFWKPQVNTLLEVEESAMAEFEQDLSLFEDKKTDLLGEQFVVRGRVKNNEMFDRLEFVVSSVKKADASEEAAKVAAAPAVEKKEVVEEKIESAPEEVKVEAVEPVVEAASEVKEEVIADEKVEETVVAAEKESVTTEAPAVSLDAVEEVAPATEEKVEAAPSLDDIESVPEAPVAEEVSKESEEAVQEKVLEATNLSEAPKVEEEMIE